MTVCLTMLNKCNKCMLNSNKYNFLSSTQRTFSVVLLDDSTLDISIDTKCTVGELFQRICDKLDVKENDIFGIARKLKENEYHFLAHDEKISKFLSQMQKQSKNVLNNVNMNANILYNQWTNAGSPSHSSSRLLPNKLLTSFGVNKSNSSDVSNSNGSQQQPPPPPPPPTTTATPTPPSDLVSYSSISISNKTYTQTSLSAMSSCSCTSMEPVITLYFAVKYYVTDPLVLRDSKTRYFYYLQLRRNYLNINHRMSDERYFVLASLALLVDYGPYEPSAHFGKYFTPSLYFPKWMIARLGEKFIFDNMPRLHEQQSRQTIANSQNKFCMEMSSDDEFPFNFHPYSVYKNKEETPGTICLGISPRGILVFELRSLSEISLISTFQWSSVAKLNTDRKKFEIHINCDSKVRKYTYYTSCEKFSKYLLELSKSTHTFTSNIFARLANQKTLANYVSESYSEKVLAYSENRVEPYEEREIRAKSQEKLSKVVEEEEASGNIRSCELAERKDSDETLSSTIKLKHQEQQQCNSLVTASAAADDEIISSSEMNSVGNVDYDRSSSLSSFSMSSYETPLSMNYSKIINDINLDGLNLTLSFGVDNTVSSKSREIYQRPTNKPGNFSTRGIDTMSDYYESANIKNSLNESSQETVEYQVVLDQSHQNYSKPKATCMSSGSSSCKSSSSSSSSSASSSYNHEETLNQPSPLDETEFLINPLVISQNITSTSNNNITPIPVVHFNSLPNMDLIASITNFSSSLTSTTHFSDPHTVITHLNSSSIMPNSISSVNSKPSSLPTSQHQQHQHRSVSKFGDDEHNVYLNDMITLIHNEMASHKCNHEYLNDDECCYSCSSSSGGDTEIGRQTVENLDKSSQKSEKYFDIVNEADYINRSYVNRYKYKSPPSYEESVRKMMKSSESSSLSSSFNDDAESSLRSKTVIQSDEDRLHHENDGNCEEEDGLAQNEEKEIIYENVNPEDDSSEENNEMDGNNQERNNNDIRLSLENLEEIRVKAASMSLPLLTALCSDQTLIKSLEKNRKNQASF